MTNETIYIYLKNQKNITSMLEIDFIKNKKEVWTIPTDLYEDVNDCMLIVFDCL